MLQHDVRTSTRGTTSFRHPCSCTNNTNLPLKNANDAHILEFRGRKWSAATANQIHSNKDERLTRRRRNVSSSYSFSSCLTLSEVAGLRKVAFLSTEAVQRCGAVDQARSMTRGFATMPIRRFSIPGYWLISRQAPWRSLLVQLATSRLQTWCRLSS